MLTASQFKCALKLRQAVARVGVNIMLYGSPFAPPVNKKRKKKCFRRSNPAI